MDILDKLIQASSSKDELTIFLAENDNAVELTDFFISQPYSKLINSKNRIENYILYPGIIIFNQLDFENPNEIALVSYLLDYSERFGLITEFEQLFYLHKNKNLEITRRIKAASKFLIGITNISHYSDRIADVLGLLKTAYLEEEDSVKPIIATGVNFYAQVVHNFAAVNKNGVREFRANLERQIAKEDYSFLKNDIYALALNIEIENNVVAYCEIQSILDEYLSRKSEYLPFNQHSFLIEVGTNYVNQLQGIDVNFRSLTNLCSQLYRQIANDTIFNSLQRGVAVLQEQNQMLGYMHSYGNMHYAKIVSAINDVNILENLDDYKVEIYDWGCGQGIASFILQEFYEINNSKTVLIEPSEICLKRASAHLRKLNPEIEITTINKDLDSLTKKDFNSQIDSLKIHLFSNILDVQSFSMEKLLELINNGFKGNNSFVCVSPFINSIRTNRLNNFMEAFRQNTEFKELLKVDNMSGTWQGNWSRSIRVFKTIL
jgi:hypothetical protein